MKKLILLAAIVFFSIRANSQACIGSTSITITPPPDSVTGCYFPGNTITVCISVTDYAQTNSDWFCGLEALIGPGWDTTTIQPVSAAPSCDGQGVWTWFPSCTSQAPGSGLTYGPGFYYDSQANSPNGTIDGIAGNNFGDNCSANTWTFCFQITASTTLVGTVSGIIGGSPYMDYDVGNWGSPGCIDPPITLPYCINNCTVTVPTVVTTDITTCYGDSTGSAMVTPSNGTPPYTYLWSTGATTNNISGLPGGIYSVIVTDASGCQKTVYLQIQQPQDITLSATVIGVGCSATSTGSITSNVNGGITPYSYLWNNGATTGSISGLTAGTYTLTVTDSSGCTKTDNWTIISVPPLNVTYTSTDATCGLSNGSAAVTANGTPPYNYSWTPPVSTGPTAAGLSQGMYIVQISDSNGCIVTDTITINSIATFTVTTSSNTANCAGTGGSGAVSINGSSGPYSFQWSPSGGTDSIASNLNAGTYTVVITDANNCSQTVTVVVGQLTSTVIVNAQVSQSPCDTTSLATITANPSNGTGPYSYQWSSGGNTQTVTGLGAGTYTVTVTDANQCTATSTAALQPYSAVTVTTSSTPSCNNSSTGSASASGTGGTPSYSYQWSNGSNTSNVNGVAAGNYTVTVSDANTCTASAIVNVASLPAINVIVIPDTTNGAPPLTANFTNNSTGGVSYSWNFGDGGTSSSHDATHEYTSDGTYEGYLAVINSDGCSDTARFTITVETSSSLVVFNVFTPNTDSHNDFWNVTAHGILSLSAEIYNRWGEKIFEHDYTNGALDGEVNIWNGVTESGKLASDGTYFYIIKAHANDKDYDQSGTITLIRKNQ